LSQKAMKEFLFPPNLEDTQYRVFPEELEQDELVLFHGTAFENLASINENGFRLPDPNGDNPLRGVSFARHSALALSHAMTQRNTHPGDYCILAVRYPSFDFPHICLDGLDIVHDYQLVPQPERVGFCIVPASYQFI